MNARTPSDDRGTPDRRRRGRMVLGAVAALVMIAGGIAIAVSTNGSLDVASSEADTRASSRPSPTSDSRSDPSAVPSPGEAKNDSGSSSGDEGDAVLADFLVVTARQLPAEEVAGSAAIGSVAEGGIVSELEAESLELDVNEWTKTGTPVIVWSRPAASPQPGADGAVVVEACVDTSAVVITAKDGTPIPSSPTTRAINLFTLAPGEGGGLRVVDRTFPDNPQC